MSHGGGGRRAAVPIYQIDFTAVASGKHFASSKRRVRWRFGFANTAALEAGETGTACRGEEHDVTLVWSVTSGKRLILADGHEVHYSNVRGQHFEFSWTMKGNHVLKVIAFAAPPVNPVPNFRQYDFFVDGQSFFTMPKVYRLGLNGNSPATGHGLPPAAHRSPTYSNYSRPEATSVVHLETPQNEDEEEAFLKRALEESMQDAQKAAQAQTVAQPPAPAPASAEVNLLDFGEATPSPAPTNALVKIENAAPSSEFSALVGYTESSGQNFWTEQNGADPWQQQRQQSQVSGSLAPSHVQPTNDFRSSLSVPSQGQHTNESRASFSVPSLGQPTNNTSIAAPMTSSGVFNAGQSGHFFNEQAPDNSNFPKHGQNDGASIQGGSVASSPFPAQQQQFPDANNYAPSHNLPTSLPAPDSETKVPASNPFEGFFSAPSTAVNDNSSASALVSSNSAEEAYNKMKMGDFSLDAKPPANPFGTTIAKEPPKPKTTGEKKPVMNAPPPGAMVVSQHQGGNWGLSQNSYGNYNGAQQSAGAYGNQVYNQQPAQGYNMSQYSQMQQSNTMQQGYAMQQGSTMQQGGQQQYNNGFTQQYNGFPQQQSGQPFQQSYNYYPNRS